MTVHDGQRIECARSTLWAWSDCDQIVLLLCSDRVLQDDPELKPLFDQIKEGGMGALQRVMSDPVRHHAPAPLLTVYPIVNLLCNITVSIWSPVGCYQYSTCRGSTIVR